MSSKEQEYKEMFLSEALDNYEQLNELFTQLEKDNSDSEAIDSIFRITHTLKGNAMGMGFEAIAGLSHVMEDIFSAVKEGKLKLNKNLFNSLFTANDKLGELIEALKDEGKKVNYKGIKTKLEVILRKLNKDTEEKSDDTAKKEDKPAKAKSKGTEESPKVEPPSSAETQAGNLESNDDESSKNTEAEEAEEVIADEIEMVDNSDSENEDGPMVEEGESQPKITFSDLVQVPVRKLDMLMNQVGQLIIERDRLMAMGTMNGTGKSRNDFTRLQRITSDLQYGVMDVRLVQIGFLFNKFHRIVRDVASIEEKQVDLQLKGTEIEIDRNILKIMSDSLVHIVRNAVSHGIEDAETRKKRGKVKAGQVTLNALNEKDNIIIEVSDDGQGMDVKAIKKKIVEKGLLNDDMADQLNDREILSYIFEPGFSNAEKITEVSGRGVGMDVVKRATESIGGQISIDTEYGKGSVIRLSMPSSMAVKGALLFLQSEQEYAFALSYTEAVISLYKKDLHKVNSGLMAKYLDKTISIIFLRDLLELKSLNEAYNEGTFHKTYNRLESSKKLDVIVISHSGRLVGVVVDKLLQQKEIVEKTLPKPLDNIKLLTGSTIMGNGNVCLVVDAAAITDILFRSVKKSTMEMV